MDRIYLICLVALFAYGCSDTSSDSDEMGDDTDNEGGEVFEMELFLEEFLSSVPMADCAVTANGETMTADAFGAVTLSLPGEQNVLVTVEQEGFPNSYLYTWMVGYNGSSWTTGIPSNSSIGLIGDILDLTYDDTKGLVSIFIHHSEATEDSGIVPSLDGATVELDANYGAALMNNGTLAGLTPGNTVMGKGVTFVNVDPGTISPTITTPNGETCERGHSSFEVVAGSYTESHYYCF